MDILHPNSDSLKTCSICQRVLPANPEHFSRNKNSKDGLYSRCKQCKSAEAKAYRAAHREELLARKRQYYAAHQEECQDRSRQYQAAHREELLARKRQYYADHKEQFSEYGKQYRRDHQEQISERQRKYRETHAEELSARRRRYREAHAGELSAKQRIYYAEHLEARLHYIKQYKQTERGIIAKRADTHNRRARKRNAPGSHTTEELQQQLKRQKGKCYYCAVKLSTSRDSWNADHIIPLSRGGSNDISNIVIACPRCNRKKNDKLPHEWTDGGRLI